MKHQIDTAIFDPAMSAQELSKLGIEKIAYIRPMASHEVMKKFPMVDGLPPGVILWALFSASGDPLAIADDPAGVLSNAHEMNLFPVSLH